MNPYFSIVDSVVTCVEFGRGLRSYLKSNNFDQITAAVDKSYQPFNKIIVLHLDLWSKDISLILAYL